MGRGGAGLLFDVENLDGLSTSIISENGADSLDIQLSPDVINAIAGERSPRVIHQKQNLCKRSKPLLLIV